MVPTRMEFAKVCVSTLDTLLQFSPADVCILRLLSDAVYIADTVIAAKGSLE